METRPDRSTWPPADGQMARRIRALDWSTTPLGPIEAWPQSLRTATEICLGSAFPGFIYWGPDCIRLYNDAAIPVLGRKHPEALGQPAREAGLDVWSTFGPLVERVRATGEPFLAEEVKLVTDRGGAAEEVYFTLSYSALRDPAGAPMGVFAVAMETTARVVAERKLRESEERQTFLVALNDALRPLADPTEIQGEASRLVGEHLGATRAAYGEVHGDDLIIARDYVTSGARSLVGRYRMADFGERLLPELHAGRSLAIPDIATSDRLSADERAAYAALGIAALLGVPVVKEGRFVANLSIHSAVPTAWTTAEVALVEEVVNRTWDAVERARAEAALRESEARFRAVWEATSDAMALSDPEGTVLAANPAYLELYGYSEDEVVGRGFNVIFPEEMRAVTRDQYRDVFDDPLAPRSYEASIRRKDGAERQVESRVDFVVEDGRRTRMISAIRDVTERHAAEAALRASEERLRRMVNIHGVGVLTFDATGRLLDANDAFLATTGYSRDLIRSGGITWRTMTPPEYVAESEAQMARMAVEGRIGPYEKEYLCANGSRSWMLFAGAALGDGTIVEYCIDISSRKRVEMALRASEERYRTLFESIEEGYALCEVVYDEDGHAVDLRAIDTNRAFAAVSGIANAAGRTTRELVPHADRGAVELALRVARTGEPARFETYLADVERWLDVRITRVGDQPMAPVAVVFADISQRKRSEEALRESAARQAFLVRLGDALRSVGDPVAIQETAARLLGEQIDADRVVYVEMADDERTAHVQVDYCRGGVTSVVGMYDMEDFGPRFLSRLREDEHIVIDDLDARVDLDAVERAAYTALQIRAFINVPLIKEGRFVAFLAIHQTTPRQWTSLDLSLVDEVAERTLATVELARAAVALRDSEEELRLITDSTPALIGTIDHEQRYRFVNDTMCRFVDRPREEVIGRTVREVIGERAYARLRPSIEASLRGERVRVEDVEPNKYGPGFHGVTEEQYLPRIAPDGTVEGLYFMALDASERRQTERALRAAESRLDAALQAARMAYWDWDARTDTTIGSPSMSDVFGLQPGETVESSESGLRLVHPDDRDRVRASVWGAREQGKGWHIEFRIVRPRDGQVAWLEERATATVDPATGKTHTTGLVWDITGRMTAEQALRESEERYRLIVERATDYAIFTTDRDGRIDTWPPGAAAVFGWSAEEAIGQSIAMTFTPEDLDAGEPVGEFALARDAGVAPNVRWHLRKDGSRVFIEGAAYALRTGDGTFQGLFKIGQDVTERHQAEQARRDEEEQLREELATQVAEATAELRALSGRLITVQEEERRHLARELHDEIGQALTGLQLQLATATRFGDASSLVEAQAIVRELTARVSELSMDLRPSALDTLGLVPALYSHIDRYQFRTGIAVDVQYSGVDQRFPAAIEVAAYRVAQEALTNIARHANAKRATVRLLADATVLTVQIHDDGRGFDPAATHVAGGLSGMRERIELLGGSVWIDAAPGEGVVVTAELPLHALEDRVAMGEAP